MKLCVVTETLGSAPDARAYFFLSCQEKVAKKKSRPQRRPAAPGALRCSATTGGLRNSGLTALRQSSPFFPLRPALLDDAKGRLKTIWLSTTRYRIRLHSVFLAPRAAPSNGGEPGAVGEHCLRGAAPSCAAARLAE